MSYTCSMCYEAINYQFTTKQHLALAIKGGGGWIRWIYKHSLTAALFAETLSSRCCHRLERPAAGCEAKTVIANSSMGPAGILRTTLPDVFPMTRMWKSEPGFFPMKRRRKSVAGFGRTVAWDGCMQWMLKFDNITVEHCTLTYHTYSGYSIIWFNIRMIRKVTNNSSFTW